MRNVSYMIKGRLTDGYNLFLKVNLIILGDPNIMCSISSEDTFRSKCLSIQLHAAQGNVVKK